jgi:hypothetical protein
MDADSGLRQIRGWPDEFSSREENDMALRVLDAGWGIWYEPDLVLRHPRAPQPAPGRHASKARTSYRADPGCRLAVCRSAVLSAPLSS